MKTKSGYFVIPTILMCLVSNVLCAALTPLTAVVEAVREVQRSKCKYVRVRKYRKIFGNSINEVLFIADFSQRQRKRLLRWLFPAWHATENPDCAVADPGCARCVGGAEALDTLVASFRKQGFTVSEEKSEVRFRFGNGTVNAALCIYTFPVSLGGRSSLLTIHKVPGSGPILITNGVLRAISHGIDYDTNSLRIRHGENQPLIREISGHLLFSSSHHPKSPGTSTLQS